MKTNHIHKSKTAITRRFKYHGRAVSQWAALLALIGGMAALPLTLSAAITENSGTNITINAGSGTSRAGVTYDNAGSTSIRPVYVSGSGWFSGTNITVTATAATGNGRNGVTIETSGTVNFTDSAITANLYGITASGTSVAILNNTNIGSGNIASGHGVNLATSSTLLMTGGTITTGTTSAAGVTAATASGVNLRDTVINSYGNGVSLSGTSAGVLDSVKITTQNGAGLNLATSSTATITGGAITTVLGGNGITAATASVLDVRDTVINSYATGVSVTGTSTAVLANVNVTTQAGTGLAAGSGGTLTFSSGTINSAGIGVDVLAAAGGVTLNDTEIHSGGNGMYLRGNTVLTASNCVIDAQGFGVQAQSQGSLAYLTDVQITAAGRRGVTVLGGFVVINGTHNSIYVSTTTAGNTSGLYTESSGTIYASNLNVLVDSESGHGVAMGFRGSNVMVLNNTTIDATGANAHGLNIAGTTNNYFEMTGGYLNSVNGAAISVSDGTSQLVFNDTIVSGSNLLAISGSGTELTINAGNTQLTGDNATGSDSSNTTVNLDNSTLTSNVNANDDSTITITGSNGSTIIGDLTGSGSSNTTVNLDDSTLTGNTAANDDSTITITGSNGSTIIGDLTGSGSSTIDVTITGSDSSITGNIDQRDDSHITVEVGDGGCGQGGWNGGDLVVNPGGSWDFSGTNSTLDNLDNNGNITTDLDTDTGAGGKIVITGTGSGTGTIHIDTTGNGSGNPDDLINDLVVNPGPDWNWDDIDWGLEEIVKSGTNADGSNHFTKKGNSVAGSVLNSSAALQQTMWFAQQNSLLKRMGDLRFNQSNQTVNCGKDDKDVVTKSTTDKLLDNVWIRSYGQQLNVGGKVSGHSFEQLVYGVDLGTDHKFTLDNHNDLYLGVYAGYGRSDVDYRVAGAEATLNSYYGGLYATWLHDSGLYVDLTFKAASVDNELKAPYGANQLNAEYNDLNLGGSIEIGKKFTFQDDWFIEPQAQINYLHLLAEDYNAGPMSIQAQDLDAIQFRVGSLFGRTIKLANGGALQPYLKVSGVEMVSSGGAIRNGYQSIRSNIDGARAELGGGIVWQMDEANQLHLDYEASFGDKYDKPWGLTAGFRHQF